MKFGSILWQIDILITAWFKFEYKNCFAHIILIICRPQIILRHARFYFRFRPVSIVLNNRNRPEPGGTVGQPAVGFWSRPLIDMQLDTDFPSQFVILHRYSKIAFSRKWLQIELGWLAPFFLKTLGSDNSFTLNENNCRFLRYRSLNSM